MSRPSIVPPPETLEKQALASDPAGSAWVSANAGSGKTHVLAQRVVRLLLAGIDPSRILCLTYTRAAAANMASRVFDSLGKWSLLDDAALAEAIRGIEGKPPDRRKLDQARRLFARALETPGGLKIQTIHAFCEAILQRFPLEANIAGHFELLDTQMEAALLAEARRDLLSGAASGPDADLSAAFAEVLAEGRESGLDRLLQEILADRDGLRRLIDEIGNDPLPFSSLFSEFGFAEDDDAAIVAGACWPLPGFAPDAFEAFAAAARETDARTVLGRILPDATRAFAEADPVRRLGLLRDAFLKKADGEPYGESAFRKALRERLPGIHDRYLQAAQAVMAAADRLALLRMLQATRAALVLADRLIARYEQLKRARGFLDFNDLIGRTLGLLMRADAGPWVQYKLDQGIDHILIDEAQDTSPDQWKIVRLLAEEFFAGRGSRDEAHRTIFAVGDEKQSIYSFQGAEPAAFAENRTVFAEKVASAAGIFGKVELRHSFRSTEDVLAAVDHVFSDEEARRGLTRDPEPVQHIAIRAGAPGYVELWSSLSPEEVEEPDDWTQAIDHASAPAVRLAETIAATIEGWLKSGAVLEGRGRPIEPGDIMVLVRKRDRFVHALSRSLKNRDIAVAGADRLRLTAHIAVKDLLALGRFIMQPGDDLSLAAVLRSPLFDVAEERLFTLSWQRGRRTLFAALKSAAETDASLAATVSELEEWRNAAAFRPVFEFYAGVLAGTPGRAGARARFVARLGQEADDVLDEFLGFCLASERSGFAGLEALLAALDGAAPEIKREMDQSRAEIRIMTVHAAKGLEAPVVFLVDPGSAPFSDSHLPRLIPFEPQSGLWRSKGYLWRAGKDLANSVSRRLETAARLKAEQEYRRLLYVGMTRAEDRLIVCGYRGLRRPSGPTWHAMVEAALAAAPETRELAEPAACAPVLRFRVTPVGGTVAAGEAGEPEAEAGPLPPELREPLPPAPVLPRPLAPSGAAALVEPVAGLAAPGRSPVLDTDETPAPALARGTAIHRMLQMLPGMPAAAREEAALRYLARAGAAWPEAERLAVWHSVRAVLEDGAFAPVFAEGSRAEVAVMGTLDIGGRPRAVSGKIDRLAVDSDSVVVVDYKTGRAVPAGPAEVPEAYVAQLALYAALLKPIYPGRTVSAALLFTEGPRLVPLDPKVMEHALARLGAR